MLLAFAWPIRNSSSIRGNTGEKMALATKLRNHKEVRNRRTKKAVPFREVNLFMVANVTRNPRENQQKE
jgi:hypothetical protein